MSRKVDLTYPPDAKQLAKPTAIQPKHKKYHKYLGEISIDHNTTTMVDSLHHSPPSRDLMFRDAREKLLQPASPLRSMTSFTLFPLSTGVDLLTPSHQELYHSLNPGTKLRRVHFQEKVTTFVPPLFPELTMDQAHQLWYKQSEIAAFKSSARRIVLSTGTVDEQPDEGECDPSGLERFSLQRSFHKKRAIQCVVKASKRRKDLTPLFVASGRVCSLEPDLMISENSVSLIYQHCSAVATEIALEQGFKDFCQVYDPLASLLGDANIDDMEDMNSDRSDMKSDSNSARQNYNDYFFSDIHTDQWINAVSNHAAGLLPLFTIPHDKAPKVETIPNNFVSWESSLTPGERLRWIREKQAKVAYQIAANFRAMGCNNTKI
jgi:hypothetical protein